MARERWHAKGGTRKVARDATLTRVRCAPRQAITYNAMIACCVRAGEAAEASALLQEMRGRGIKPDTICFNMVIGALARSGARQEAEQTLQHLLDDGVKVPSAAT